MKKGDFKWSPFVFVMITRKYPKLFEESLGLLVNLVKLIS